MAISKQELKVTGRMIPALIRLLKGERSAPTLIEKWARINPDNPAVLFQDRTMSYWQLNALTNRVANHFLSLGAKEGDVVAVYMENCPEFLALIAGLNKIGVVGSLINTHIRHKPLAHALTICSPRWAVASESLLPTIEDVLEEVPLEKKDIWVWDGEAPPEYDGRDLDEATGRSSLESPPNVKKPKFDDHIINIYTSGTTGLPKAARVSNRRMFFSGYAMGRGLTDLSPGDVIYAPLPLYHSLAMFVGWGSTLATGAALAIRTRFSASEFWADAIKYNATVSIFIGEMPRYLLARPPSPQEKEHRIKKVITVGLRGNIWEEFQKRFNLDQIFEFYGATETNVGIMNVEGRPGMLGRLMALQSYVVRWDPQNEAVIKNDKGFCVPIEVGEEGMLIGRISPLLNLLGFDGYVDDEATKKKIMKGVFRKGDEFFVTGDVVKLHDDHWVSFMDRSGDTYRWRGENVATKEVELVMDGCPGIAEVNVYGVKVPNEEGAAGMAAVVLDREWDGDAVSKYLIENLPLYARPLFVRACKELPKTSTLKHIKFGLRKEGFDPAKVEDPIYFWDRQADTYVAFDEGIYADIVEGKAKL